MRLKRVSYVWRSDTMLLCMYSFLQSTVIYHEYHTNKYLLNSAWCPLSVMINIKLNTISCSSILLLRKVTFVIFSLEVFIDYLPTYKPLVLSLQNFTLYKNCWNQFVKYQTHLSSHSYFKSLEGGITFVVRWNMKQRQNKTKEHVS